LIKIIFNRYENDTIKSFVILLSVLLPALQLQPQIHRHGFRFKEISEGFFAGTDRQM
jgi:hypothetical protein